MPSVVPVSSPSAEASLVLTQSRANCSRAAALREVLKYSEAVTKEAESTLSGYSGHLETLFTSVQEVATQAEVSHCSVHLYHQDDSVPIRIRAIFQVRRDSEQQ